MKTAAVLALALLLTALAITGAHAQSVANYAPVVRSTGIAYSSISGTGNSLTWRLASIDDNRSFPTPIGFTFYYDGQAFTQFSMSTNGFIDFSSSTADGSGTLAYSRVNGQFSAATNGTLLALGPFYDDLTAPTGGTLAGNFKYLTTGSVGSRVLTVEWIGIDLFNNPTSDHSFQVKLYETTGVIEYIYGSNTAVGTYSYTVGINGPTMSAVPTPAELLTQQTANTATFSNTPQNALATIPASNTMLTFTPIQNVTPAAPISITFTSVTQSSMIVGWTDDSTTETYFAVSRSTDGSNFSPVGVVTSTTIGGTGSTYSLNQTGLVPSITYFFRITANNEASAPSNFLAGSQATNAPGSVTATGSGNWSSTVPDAPWPGGVLPTAFDNVIIADGTTVTIDTSSAVCFYLTVGQGTSGVLQYETAVARTLTVAFDVTIAPGGTFQTGAAGAVTAHVLSLAGNLTNDGTLDFSTNGNTAGAGITFTGASAATFSGTGGTTDLRTLTVNKGTSSANVLDIMPSTLTVQGVNTDVAGFLTLTNGTAKLSGTYTLTNRVFPTVSYTIGATTGLWLNNPNLTVAAQASVTATVTGLLRVTNGTLNVGTAQNHSLALSTGSTTTIEGGAVNVAGRFGVGAAGNAVTYNQSGGTLTLNTATGHTSTTLASFDLGTSATTGGSISGGTIILRNSSSVASGPRDYRNSTNLGPTGGTLQLGDASSGAHKIFILQGSISNLVLTNTSAPHTALLGAQTNVFLNTTIPVGDSLRLGGATGFAFLQIGPTLTNDGVIDGTPSGSRLYFKGIGALAVKDDQEEDLVGYAKTLSAPGMEAARQVLATAATTYTGTGSVVAPIADISLDNPAGVTIDAGIPTNVITARVNLFLGTLTNTNKVTLGNGGITSGVTQIGVASATSPGGNYDTFPVLNVGTGGYIVLYIQETVPRTTGFEIPVSRSVTQVTVNNTNGVTLAGGNLAITSNLVLTAGLLTTDSANLLTLANTVATPPAGVAASYVNGPLAIEFNVAAPTNRTFAIGKSGAFRSLQLKQVNTGGVSQTYTGEVIATPSGGTPLPPLEQLDAARYWTLSNTTNLNAGARINLGFGSDDGVPIISSARVAQANTSGGNYSNLGGTATGTPTNGTVESTVNHTAGDDFFTIGLLDFPYTWDGGGGNNLWSDPLNWSNDVVPGAGNSVSLDRGSPTAIDVDGTFAVNELALGNNVTLSLLTNTLTVHGTYVQSGSTINLGSGTLEVKGNFTRTAGTYTAATGTTLLSGAAAQVIGGGVTHFNLVLRNGGAGLGKVLTAANTFTVSNDLTVESTAQLALSAATATTMSVAGNLAYSGITGGTNIGSLTLSLTGTGKTISGASALRGMMSMRPAVDQVQVIEHSFITDPATAKLSGQTVDGKPMIVLENTYAQRRSEVEKLLAAADSKARVVINLDDMTLVRNPSSFAELSPPPSTFEMAVTVALNGSYTLADNIAMGTGRLLTMSGRLSCASFTISGAGGITVTNQTTPPNGTLGIGIASGGVGATVLTTGVNTYADGAIIEYNAAGPQTIHTPSHPAPAMLYIGGSGTKTLDAAKTISGTSGSALTKGALSVASGTTFADGGFTLSFTTSGFANILVNGQYASTGTGGISFETGPFLSNVVPVDGTTFGNLAMNFTSSTNAIEMNATGTVNVSFRNVTCGGAAGTGTAGGTLRLNETGTTNVTVTGDMSITPTTVTNTGGGFGGTASTTGTATVRGNLTTTSTNVTQPIMNATGTNTLIMAGTSAQTFTVGASTTMFTGSTLRINNPNGVNLGSVVARTYSVAGTLNFLAGNVITGINTLAITSAGTLTRTSGHVVGNLQKPVSASLLTPSFEVGSPTVYAPMSLAFASVTTAGNLVGTTIDGDHPSLGGSGFNVATSVNRYHRLTNSGIVFTTAQATFNWDPADVDPGSDPLTFALGKLDGVTWTYPTITGHTATSISVSGIAAFSDFAAANIGVTASDVSVTEGNAGTVNAVFNVTLGAPSQSVVTVDYGTADDTAIAANGDYVAIDPAQTLTFNPNDPLTQPVTVVVNGDLITELAETFFLNLSAPSGVTLADGQGLGTILNDDDAPAITIDDVSVTEGNAGTVLATFTVSLTNASKQVVTVDYETADGTASAANGDYAAVSPPQTVTFNPGDPLSQSVSITVNGDMITEVDETFLVNLSNSDNATIADLQGIGTILNDDDAPAITIDDVSVTEGNAGTVLATFTVSLTNASKQVVTVDYETADGTASEIDGDYVAVSPPQTLTFNPGDPLSQLVSITVNGDLIVETDETFFVNLSNSDNATIADLQGIGTILNDDDEVAGLTVDDVSVTEGNSGTVLATFTVTLSIPSKDVVSVKVQTADGSATAGSGDYTAINPAQTLTFNPGDPLFQTVSVTVHGDALNEADETFLLNLLDPSNAVVLDGMGVGTILNDDPVPALRINDVAIKEGNSGTSTIVFTVTLAPASGQVVTVKYATADNTATAGSGDYVAISPPQTLTFNPGNPVTGEVSVTVNGDMLIEPDETFFVNLTDPSNATIADARGVGVIVNDDVTAGIDPASAPVAETFVGPNFPNPFSSETMFPVGLMAASQVQVRIYDVRGRLVRSFDEQKNPGMQRVRWDGLDGAGAQLPSGFYVARIETEGKVFKQSLRIIR